MITIKAFAKLCGCNAQTLRYYDRIGLLNPAMTDRQSGYRYYETGQLMDFVKIRNLQKACFTIEEIKELLADSSVSVAGALERKIREEEEKLDQMRSIRDQYLKETVNMENIIRAIDAVKDLGIVEDEAVGSCLNHALELNREGKLPYAAMALKVCGETISDPDEIVTAFEGADDGLCPEEDASLEISFGSIPLSDSAEDEASGLTELVAAGEWTGMASITDNIPELRESAGYLLRIHLTPETQNRVDLQELIDAAKAKAGGNTKKLLISVSFAEGERDRFELFRARQ